MVVISDLVFCADGESGILSFLLISNSWLKVKFVMCTLREINEPYPNFVNFDFSNEVSDEEYVYFTDYLQSAQLNKLGDTNSGVPGRLLECSEIYLEVGAYKYILDKLMICLT